MNRKEILGDIVQAQGEMDVIHPDGYGYEEFAEHILSKIERSVGLMRNRYTTYEDVTHSDLKAVEEIIDEKHMNKCLNDLIYTLNLKNQDHKDIVYLKEVFKMGYLAAHVDITPDDSGRKAGCYNYPFYK